MKCTDLEAYWEDWRDGKASAAFEEHLRECAPCRELAAELGRTPRWLALLKQDPPEASPAFWPRFAAASDTASTCWPTERKSPITSDVAPGSEACGLYCIPARYVIVFQYLRYASTPAVTPQAVASSRPPRLFENASVPMDQPRDAVVEDVRYSSVIQWSTWV